MPEAKRESITAGLIDGLMGATQPHPAGEGIPPIRPAFDPDYEAGYDVAETWARIARDWPGCLLPGFDDAHIGLVRINDRIA